MADPPVRLGLHKAIETVLPTQQPGLKVRDIVAAIKPYFTVPPRYENVNDALKALKGVGRVVADERFAQHRYVRGPKCSVVSDPA